jgi:hypothetical protein
MKKNKQLLLSRLFCLTLSVFCAVKAAGYVREIRDNQKSIAQYRAKIRGARAIPSPGLSQLESRLAELRALEVAAEQSDPAARPRTEDPVGTIRDTLRAHAIGVERLRTLSAGGIAMTEFTLSSAPVNFLAFLQGASDLPLPLAYVGIKPNGVSAAINVTVRFSHEP